MKQERRSPQAGSSNPFAEELRQTNDWGKAGEGGGKKEVKEKEKVNLGLSGALTADQNTYKVSLKQFCLSFYISCRYKNHLSGCCYQIRRTS